MTSKERVLAACAFTRPDRIPRFDDLWGASDDYRREFGDLSRLTDVVICCPIEGIFGARSRVIKEENGWTYSVDEWGRTIRTRAGAYFSEVIEVPLPVGTDIDAVEFDSPRLDARYLLGRVNRKEADRAVEEQKRQFCVFGKTGGPFLRTSFARGEVQFLLDMLTDPPLARALAAKVAAHLAAVGLEELRRWGFHDTGMWIFDDMACNRGPVFSPESFEKVLLPSYRRMIKTYKDAGARYVFLHSDGDIRPILDMLADAGIDGINPLERRAGLDPVAIRAKYPRLILAGGMDNTDTLVWGPVDRVEAETREIIDLGRNGGVIIGTHSISPEVPLKHFLAYHKTCATYGDFASP